MKPIAPIAPCVLCALAMAVPAWGQPEGITRMTLDEAIDRGLRASPRLREADARADAAGAVVEQRRAVALPQVAAQAGYTRTNHVDAFALPSAAGSPPRILYPDIPDNVRSRLDLQWPLYTGGRLAALERSARHDGAAVAAERDAARSDLTLEITRAYWTLVTTIDVVAVVDESIARMQAHLDEARRQLEAGVIAPHEVLAVDAQLARQRMLGIQARGNRDVAEADLARLTGASPLARIEPATLLERPAKPDAAADALVTAAQQARGDRRALAERVTAADERQKAALVGARPAIGAVAGVDYARPNPRIFPREGSWRPSWDASVNVSWTLFDGGRNDAEAREASAAARALRARLDEFDAMLTVEIRQRLTELSTNLAVIDASEQAVRAAGEARRVAGERFRAGVALSTDVLDAQVALLQAELERAQAVAAARVAEARLARTLGR
jgi:outer membrane protein TolC